MEITSWLKKNITQRHLISKTNGDKVSYVQIIGFILIAMGIIYMASFLLPSGIEDYLPPLKLDDNPVASGMAISFFITMLGVSFAFPTLLEGNEGLSTMRIVVFMMINVICLLLIKIGWAKEIHSLKEIGLDQYWMGVIAFVFGAKATQSYFESKIAVAKSTSDNKDAETIADRMKPPPAKTGSTGPIHQHS